MASHIANAMHSKAGKDLDRDMALAQLERMLGSAQFRSSQRSCTFFRYVVLKTLSGDQESVKERTIGVEVFHREPSFDTASDCIVRVSASEVRKRIAQYYQEEGRQNELRIDLPPGSYLVRFRLPSAPSAPSLTSPETLDTVEAESLEDGKRAIGSFALWKKLTVATVVLVLVSIVAFMLLRSRSDAGMNRFWGPVFDSSTPVMICVGTVEPADITPGFRKRFTPQMADAINGAAQPATPETSSMDWPALTLTDAVQTTRITEMLTRHGKQSLLRSSENVTLTDLRAGPAVLVGVLENSWTLQMVSKLRFHPRMDSATQKMWIEDAQHPERKNWSTPWGISYSESGEDYALVTRARNPLSGQIAVILGGLGMHASQAAGEFVTNPSYVNKLSSVLRDPNKNVQIVLRIDVIKGEASPPQIVAEYYW